MSASTRGDLSLRLSARLPELEQAALARVTSIEDPASAADPGYVVGLRAAVAAGIRYAVAGVESGTPEPGPIPGELFVQVRHAARIGVRLDSVIRRFVATHTVLDNFVMQEAERCEGLQFGAVRRIGENQALLLDRIIDAVSKEYTASRGNLASGEQRRLDRVKKLLQGEMLDTGDFAYEFDGWHVGLVVRGQEAPDLVRSLAAALDRRPLLVQADDETVWGWLGSRRRPDGDGLATRVPEVLTAGASLSVGEPSAGLTGWRLTHRQAMAAHPITLWRPEKVVHYRKVGLLSAVLANDLLATSLQEQYLEPLSSDGDGGRALRETLHAYFEAERNVTSAAAALGVRRHTVANRLRVVEELLERPLSSCGEEIRVALQLEEVRPSAATSLPAKS
jgi:PucR C-terminal helix-turn-helix domain/GGDEF-like domain